MSSMIELFAPMDRKETAGCGLVDHCRSSCRIFFLASLINREHTCRTLHLGNSTDRSVCLFEQGRVAASSMMDHCNLDYLPILTVLPNICVCRQLPGRGRGWLDAPGTILCTRACHLIMSREHDWPHLAWYTRGCKTGGDSLYDINFVSQEKSSIYFLW
jgi:hypothetical protein